MATAPQPYRHARPEGVNLKVSAYDQVAGLLISLLMLMGGAVLLMFLIWLTMTMVFRPRSVPVKLVENIAGRGDNAPGFERDMEAPGLEEMPELAEPQLEAALEAVTDAVSAVAASTDVLDTSSLVTSRGEGGKGDSRPPGPLGEGDNIIPRWERWEVRWTSNGLQAYARQLDYFKIELGAAGGGRTQVDYAVNLSQSRPDTRQGTADDKRMYMTWKGGQLQQFDRQLLANAGIPTGNRLLMQFYPEEVEDQLAWIEMEHAKTQGRSSAKEFLKTIFGVRAKGRDYEFFVAEQRFRPAPP